MKLTEIKPVPPEFSPDEAKLARQLLSLRRSPSPTLQRRIQTIPRPDTPAARIVPRSLVGGVIALLMVALLFISPPVQATLDEAQKVIGQIHLSIRSVWPKPSAMVVALEAKPMSLAEAQAALLFEVVRPAYLPDGLSLSNDKVLVAQAPAAMAKMEWRDPQGGFVQLSAAASNQANPLFRTMVGPESSETIRLNNQEALLVRGGWDGQTRTWSHQNQVTMVIWTTGGVQYRLLSYSDFVSLAELIKMAESIH